MILDSPTAADTAEEAAGSDAGELVRESCWILKLSTGSDDDASLRL